MKNSVFAVKSTGYGFARACRLRIRMVVQHCALICHALEQVNTFVIHTAGLLNRFSSLCERKLEAVDR
jgi:hypothetical protein